MKGVLALLLAGAATPALAQQSGASAPAAPTAVSSCTPEHAAMGHCKLPVPAQAPTDPQASHGAPAREAPASSTAGRPATSPAPAASASCTPEHAAMGHCTMPGPAKPRADSGASQGAPAPEAPRPAGNQGHAAPAAPSVNASCTPEHAAMGHCKLDPSVPAPAPIPIAPPPPAARSGPENGADLFYDPRATAASREEMRKHHGGLDAYKILIDQAEVKIRNGRETYGWDAQGWYGGDIDKLWIKTEGEGAFGGSLESAEVQALWSRAIDPWFDLQLGLRYDIRPDPERAYLVAGIQGLAPYWFEVDGSLFLSNKGDLSARFEAEYDLRITQRLILQPMVEFDLAAQDVPELGIGSGLSEASFGARLRYEVFPRSGAASIAPYVGIEYERAFGDTADFRRADGEKAGGWNFLVGLRSWF